MAKHHQQLWKLCVNQIMVSEEDEEQEAPLSLYSPGPGIQIICSLISYPFFFQNFKKRGKEIKYQQQQRPSFQASYPKICVPNELNNIFSQKKS